MQLSQTPLHLQLQMLGLCIIFLCQLLMLIIFLLGLSVKQLIIFSTLALTLFVLFYLPSSFALSCDSVAPCVSSSCNLVVSLWTLIVDTSLTFLHLEFAIEAAEHIQAILLIAPSKL